MEASLSKRCRTLKRSMKATRGKRVLTVETRLVKLFDYVQTSTDWQEWSFQTVSWQKAAAMAGAYEAEAITRYVDGHVMVVGYKRLKPVRAKRPSPCTLTFSTIRAVGNAVGKASDVKLDPWEERQVEKFVMWPLEGDDKAVAVRPRMSRRDMCHAVALMKQAA